MRHFTCLFVAVCISACTLSSAGEQEFSYDQQKVIDVHDARVEAFEKRDFAAWSPYDADDCIFSGESESQPLDNRY